MRNLEHEQQQELFKAIIKTQEEERERIAEQLHNSVGQLLYAVKLSLNQIKLERPEYNSENIEALEKAGKLISETIAECRRTSHGLMPSLLKDFGLNVAIRDLCDQLNPSINIRCICKISVPIKDKYVEVVVFRIVQELILNIVKHSEATEANCLVEIDSNNVLISVQDNGKGLETGGAQGKGIGLASIKNRIALMRGHLNISSKPNKGTAVKISFPREGF